MLSTKNAIVLSSDMTAFHTFLIFMNERGPLQGKHHICGLRQQYHMLVFIKEVACKSRKV